MSLNPDIFRYLDQFGTTRRLDEVVPHTGLRRLLYAIPGVHIEAANWIALRHDIDHDLDLALELAHHEHQRGIRASYFLLHTAPYWNDPDLGAKCRQLQAYGHEVGLHLDLVTEYAQGLTERPHVRISQLLSLLRSSGVRVCGVAAHGAKACYEYQCTNFWFWEELRPSDPARDEDGRSAEGIRINDPKWKINYPSTHAVRVGDQTLDLWTVSMKELGICYEASAVSSDQYWTDTGGGWTRSADPKDHDLSKGKHIVLMHPVWWRGPKKVYFVMCTNPQLRSRVSSTIDEATPATVLDEWTMTHTRVGREVDRASSPNSLSPILLENAIAHHTKILDSDVIEFTSLMPSHVLSEHDSDSIDVWSIPTRSTSLHDAATDLLVEHPTLYVHPSNRPLIQIDAPRWAWLSRTQRAVAHLKACRSGEDDQGTTIGHHPALSTSAALAKQLGIPWHPLLAKESRLQPEVIRPLAPKQSGSLWTIAQPVFQSSGRTLGQSARLRSVELFNGKIPDFRWGRAESSAPQASLEFRHSLDDEQYILGQVRIQSCSNDQVRVLLHSWKHSPKNEPIERETIDLGTIDPQQEPQVFRFACKPSNQADSFALSLLAPKDHSGGSIQIQSVELRVADINSYFNRHTTP